MARIQTVFKNLLNNFLDPTGNNLLILPEKIINDLSVSLAGDEEIVISMKTDRAIYSAGLSKDSNTFYKAYAVLTSKRLILAKEASRLNIFREFRLSQVNSLLYEEVNNKPTIHIDLLNSKYVLSMPPGSSAQAKEFFDTFNSVIEPMQTENSFCSSCGNKIHSDSVYCSNCGIKILETGKEND